MYMFCFVVCMCMFVLLCVCACICLYCLCVYSFRTKRFIMNVCLSCPVLSAGRRHWKSKAPDVMVFSEWPAGGASGDLPQPLFNHFLTLCMLLLNHHRSSPIIWNGLQTEWVDCRSCFNKIAAVVLIFLTPLEAHLLGKIRLKKKKCCVNSEFRQTVLSCHPMILAFSSFCASHQ